MCSILIHLINVEHSKLGAMGLIINYVTCFFLCLKLHRHSIQLLLVLHARAFYPNFFLNKKYVPPRQNKLLILLLFHFQVQDGCLYGQVINLHKVHLLQINESGPSYEIIHLLGVEVNIIQDRVLQVKLSLVYRGPVRMVIEAEYPFT
jgi:hypothetical protein